MFTFLHEADIGCLNLCIFQRSDHTLQFTPLRTRDHFGPFESRQRSDFFTYRPDGQHHTVSFTHTIAAHATANHYTRASRAMSTVNVGRPRSGDGTDESVPSKHKVNHRSSGHSRRITPPSRQQPRRRPTADDEAT